MTYIRKVKLDKFFISKNTRIESFQMVDECYYDENTAYSSSFGFWPQWLFQYNDKLEICEAIESS